MKYQHITTILLFIILCHSFVAFASENEELWNLSIEELLNTPIISVSKKKERFFDVPASISIINDENISRSIDLTIPDMLRKIPGISVAQNNAGNWSLTSRGLGGRFSNKLLVLSDGRSLYNSGYSGTFWFTQNINLNDIERIEIIRGSGGTHWGANAMNGVINIITKPSFDTLGTVFEAGTGTEYDIYANIRHGAQYSSTTAYRVSANTISHEKDQDGYNQFNESRVEFRIDSQISEDLQLTVQSGYSNASIKDGFLMPNISNSKIEPLLKDMNIESIFVLGNMKRKWSSGEWSVKAFIDKTNLASILLNYDQITYDIENNIMQEIGNKHELMIGAGIRYSELKSQKIIADEIFNMFVQDEFILSDTNRLSLGIKFEHFSNSIGTQYEYNLRYSHYWNKNNLTWSSVSNAIRSPSIAERELEDTIFTANLKYTEKGPLLHKNILRSDPQNISVEEMLAFEVGHRFKMSDKTMIQASIFRNEYENYIAPKYIESDTDPSQSLPTINHIFHLTNGSDPVSMGGEISFYHDWNDQFSISLNYSYIDIEMNNEDQIQLDPTGFIDIRNNYIEKNVASHNANLILSYDLLKKITTQCTLRHVGKISSGVDEIDPYTELDLSIVWNITKHSQFSIAGKNLLDSKHNEFDMTLDLQTIARPVERSVFCKFKYEF